MKTIGFCCIARIDFIRVSLSSGKKWDSIAFVSPGFIFEITLLIHVQLGLLHPFSNGLSKNIETPTVVTKSDKPVFHSLINIGVVGAILAVTDICQFAHVHILPCIFAFKELRILRPPSVLVLPLNDT